jgi:Toprim-like
MSIVADTLLTYLPSKRKTTPSGWTSFNAPCCQHNGHSVDTRQRGGLISNGDGGISYHCFNCGFKTSWQPGRNVSKGMRRLMRWINVPDDLINKISLQVMQENEGIEVQRRLVEIPSFNEVPLPDDAVRIDSVEHVTKHLVQVVEYMKARDLYLEDYPFYWSPSLGYRDRLIVPFYYEGKVVGWTARTVQPDKQPKYLSEQQPGYVFNLDEQRPQKIFVIVCEGPVDAIHVDGVALMGSEIKDQQALLINRLNREVIVVPDRDEAGSKLIERAIDLGWSVSLPKWADGIKDISDAVKQYGKLYTLHSIVGAVESSPLKIRLGAKKWFG